MSNKGSNSIIRTTGYVRRVSREVTIGNVALGGNCPIRLQSMTTTNTNDIEATSYQSIRIANAGAHYVRITAQGVREAESMALIKAFLKEKGYSVPLIADIHFNPNAALAAAKYVDKVRINPGNFADSNSTDEAGNITDHQYKKELDRVEQRFLPLLEVCKMNGVAIRIGVNHGSLSNRIMSRYGDTPEGMAQSAMEFLGICQKHGFHSIVVSMKASSTRIMVQATRLLVKKMDEEEMDYPIHLGVTEAGEGEDGRIKSAVGIGTLLVDGIGDTIRVSLTEEPENEIPVAKQLVDLIDSGTFENSNEEIPPIFNPFSYSRRQSEDIMGIGGESRFAVVANLSQHIVVDMETMESIGWQYNVNSKEWHRTDSGADYILTGDGSFDNLPSAQNLPLIGSNSLCKYSISNDFKSITFKTGFIHTSPADILNLFANSGKILETAVIIIRIDTLDHVYSARRAIFRMNQLGYSNSIILSLQSQLLNKEEFQLQSATLLGSFFIDGIADGIMLSGSHMSAQQSVSTGFAILQAAGARVTKTEFISCPGCGRTLFNLTDTLKAIKARTSHLKGLKIGVMGCIVNGPGEMADAHYGYVGAGPGKISLYRGREVVKRNIPESEALDDLISLIKANGDWVEPTL